MSSDDMKRWAQQQAIDAVQPDDGSAPAFSPTEITGAEILGPRAWPARHVAHDYDDTPREGVVLGAMRPCEECGTQVLTSWTPEDGAMPVTSCAEHN